MNPSTQLVLMIATPSFVVLVGILVNLVQISGIRSDVVGLRGEMSTLRAEVRSDIAGLRADMSTLRAEVHADITMLTGKVIELIDRVSRLEARTEH